MVYLSHFIYINRMMRLVFNIGTNYLQSLLNTISNSRNKNKEN